MRLLVVTGYYKPAYIYGGPIKSVSDLCEGLVNAGAEVTVFTTDANGIGKHLALEDGRVQSVHGVRVHYFPVQWPQASFEPFFSSALAAACEVEIERYNCAYLPSTWTHAMWAGARSAAAHGVPYVVSPRGSFMEWSLKQKSLKKKIYLELFERRFVERAAAIHATTELEARQLKMLGFRAPVRVIPNGIDVGATAFDAETAGLREVLGLPADSSVSLFVGRLHPMKRVDLIVAAFARVTQGFADAHLVIAGPDYGVAAQLAQQVEALRLSGKVHFCGLLEGADLQRAYQGSDLLLLVSHRENFGMVLLEAMANRLPVIVSNQVGLAEEIQQAGTGIVVGGGVDELADAWMRLLGDKELRRQLGVRGRELVHTRFTRERVTAEMLGLFEEIQTQRSHGSHA